MLSLVSVPLLNDAPPPAEPDGTSVTSRSADTSTIAVAQTAAWPTTSPATVPGQLMVRLSEGASLVALAEALQATIVQPTGRSGIAVLGFPPSTDLEDARQRMRSDERVVRVSPVGIIRGAARDPYAKLCRGKLDVSETSALQWHLEAVGAPTPGEIDLSGFTVAVLDTGVAYEEQDGHVAVDSLADVPIVSPVDFIDDDDLPLDEHQHGTHIASVIAGDGELVSGVAPGVGLMPIRILDADNTGTEADLIEALYWAADYGADIINMSLSFDEGYAPSADLSDAIDYAADAGCIMIAAAGNAGTEYVAWPAASPHVIAVGATSPVDGVQEPTDYTNLSSRIDLTAPGGDLDRDDDGDGIADGIIAESIAPGDPSESGLWMFAGTSQAAAIVSGIAVWALASDADLDTFRAGLQTGIYRYGTTASYSDGLGAGQLDVRSGVRATCKDKVDPYPTDHFQVAMLPYLEQTSSDTVTPVLRLTMMDSEGDTVNRKHEAVVTVWGDESGIYSCTPESKGTCEIRLSTVSDDADLLWAFSVDAVVRKGISYVPGAVVYASDALEIFLAAADAESDLDETMLMWAWSSEEEDTLGSVAEGFSAVNLGTGLSSSPLGLLGTRGFLEQATVTNVSLDLDGTGLSSSPLGTWTVQRRDFDGTGLSSSPLGLRSFSTVTLDGTGLSSSPLGLNAVSLHTASGEAYDDDDLDYSGPIMLRGSAAFEGSAIGTWADGGGFSSDGYPLASMLIGTGSAEVYAGARVMVPAGDGSEAVVLED